MKKLFIHQPLFRVFSPIFSGTIVYLLVLLINNNVEQVDEEFLGEELYIFIGLSYLLQESVRLFLWLLRRKKTNPNVGLAILTQVLASAFLCIVIVSSCLILFYEYVEGYSINLQELVVFNSIFLVISLVYVLLFVSNQYLHKINTEKLQHQELIRQNIEDEFLQFKREINPKLLFESLESLLALINKNEEDSEEFIDHLSMLYRYILSKKEKQLVPVKDELNICEELIKLLHKLPLQNIELNYQSFSESLVVPGTFLSLVELISRTTILSEKPLKLYLTEVDSFFSFSYLTNDKIIQEFTSKQLESLQDVYAIYTDKRILVVKEKNKRIIQIPKLTLV